MLVSKTFEIYCAGHFITASETLAVHNPYDGSLVATTYLAGDAELEEAFTAAANAAEELRKAPSFKPVSYTHLDVYKRQARKWYDLFRVLH